MARIFVFLNIFLIALVLIDPSSSYRPVVVVHGIMDRALALFDLKDAITEAHPGTKVFLIPLFQRMKSAWPMWTQVMGFGNTIKNVSDSYRETGINIIGYSQGGLISRGVIQTVDDLNIHTFISLSAPQGGQYGDTSYLRYLFPHYLKDTLYRILYSRFGQTFSVGGYWRDPHHLELYKTTTQYLSFLNAETLLPNPNLTSYRNNFIKLRKVVLIGGPDDGVITPWQSSHFAVFDEKEVVVPLRDQDAYKSDLTGLRTLDERGDLVLLTKANVSHTTWHLDKDVFKDCIEPFLT